MDKAGETINLLDEGTGFDKNREFQGRCCNCRGEKNHPREECAPRKEIVRGVAYAEVIVKVITLKCAFKN